MRCLPVFLLAVLASATVTAQENTTGIRTLFHEDADAPRGGYFSVGTGYTQVLNTGGMLVGGQGGWMIGHRVAIGGGGYGLVSRTYADPFDSYLRANGVLTRPSTIHFGYGGVMAEVLLNYRAPVHLSIPVLIGYGGCNIASAIREDDPHVDVGVLSQGFFVVQPGLQLELNVAEHARVDLGMDYRYTSDVYLTALPADALRGFSWMMRLKVGQF
jgi:hypothetical protein